MIQAKQKYESEQKILNESNSINSTECNDPDDENPNLLDSSKHMGQEFKF